MPLIFISPTSQKFAILFSLPFVRRFLVRSIFLLAIMSDFGMAETDDGLTPKIGQYGNLDAKPFVLGQGNVMGKEHIQIFSIVLEIEVLMMFLYLRGLNLMRKLFQH